MAGQFTRAPLSAVITDPNGYALNLGGGSGVFTGAPQSIVITDANGNAMAVGNGPGIVASVDLTLQQASISTTNLVASVPTTGYYRASAYAKITQAATTSSTLPSINITSVDPDGIAIISSLAAGNTGNTTANFEAGSGTFYAKAGSAITYATGGYASVGATPMQYNLHIRLEFLG